jgi:hypothetical protein
MNKKIVDLATYRVEKTLKDNGFRVERDDNNKITMLIKINKE